MAFASYGNKISLIDGEWESLCINCNLDVVKRTPCLFASEAERPD
jgi:hypothetical protein